MPSIFSDVHSRNVFELDNSGYFTRGGARFIPVGVNYWPGSCGVEMWQAWPEAEIQRDLDVVRRLGLNAIRFFLRWIDFQPQPDSVVPAMLERLGKFLAWCAQRDIAAHPSLFVGFMSGGVFWPSWHAGRNPFTHDTVIDHTCRFVQAATQVIAEHRSNVLAIDLGNELCCLPESWAASPRQIANWCRKICGVIRNVWPSALIVSGNEQAQVLRDTPWQLGNQPDCDFYSMHGYPVPGWHTVGFDGMTDPFCQGLLPFYTQIARAFGPVMLQEFGTIATHGPEQQRSYLTSMLRGAWEAGANGFLYWCLRDITANAYPYTKHPFEQSLGLIDAGDKIKPGLEPFVDFARNIPPRSAMQNKAGLYFPANYYKRDNPRNPGNDPERLAPALIVANHLLRQLGRSPVIVRGGIAMDGSPDVLFICGAILDLPEIDALAHWVKNGGRVVWHGVDPHAWGPSLSALLGAKPIDYRAPAAATINLFGRQWTLGHHPRNQVTEVRPDDAEVLAHDQRGIPMVLRRTLDKGTVVYTIPKVEDQITARSSDRSERDRWTDWFSGMLQAAAR